MEKKKVKLLFDYLQGPIWISDCETGEPLTGIDIIDNDEVVKSLNLQCLELYSSCYNFDNDTDECIFDNLRAKEIKNELLNLLIKLKNRLLIINDGTFEILDFATQELNNF